jgi:hypothetical protein
MGNISSFFSLHGEKINHHMERVPGDIRFTKSDDSPNKILWDNRWSYIVFSPMTFHIPSQNFFFAMNHCNNSMFLRRVIETAMWFYRMFWSNRWKRASFHSNANLPKGRHFQICYWDPAYPSIVFSESPSRLRYLN